MRAALAPSRPALAARAHYAAAATFKPQPVVVVRRLQAVQVRAETASTARILVQGRNVEATPAIKSYCEDKVAKATKNFEGIKEVGGAASRGEGRAVSGRRSSGFSGIVGGLA